MVYKILKMGTRMWLLGLCNARAEQVWYFSINVYLVHKNRGTVQARLDFRVMVNYRLKELQYGH